MAKPRFFVLIVALIAALIGAGAVAAVALRPSSATGSPASPVAPWQPGDPQFERPAATPGIVGVNYHALWQEADDAARARILDDFVAAGVEWVRFDISWAGIQPEGPDSYDLGYGVARIDQRLAELKARGIKVLLLFYWAPEWSTGTSSKNGVPRDAGEYAAAAAWVADRYRDSIDAIELWNEPDLAHFLANQSVATYTELVRAAYPAIKATNPDLTVVAGAPTYVNTDWYREFYELGGAGNYDALGIHPYVGKADEPPATCPPDPADAPYYPCHIPALLKLMAENGDADVPLWATEYGWSSHDNTFYGDTIPPWKRGVSEAVQAQYLLDMQTYLAQYPQVHAGFWYTDRDTAKGDPHEDGFGLLRRDLSRKPAYYAMKCATSGVCGP